MSILIKGMEMPQGCAACPYCDRNWSKPKCHAKSAKGRYMVQKLFLNSRRQDWCPLVEVPKHGRLIDADALRAGMYHEAFETDSELQRWDSGCWVRYKMFENHMDNVPTIIEAEE